MSIVIINTKEKKVIHCSLTHAAKLIGVTRLTIRNWGKKSWKENYNQFEIYYNVENVKQKPRGIGK